MTRDPDEKRIDDDNIIVIEESEWGVTVVSK